MKFKQENMVYLKHTEQKELAYGKWLRSSAGDKEAKKTEPQWPFPNSCRYKTMLTPAVISGAQQSNRTFCKNGLLLTSKLSLKEAPLVEKAMHVFFS